MATRFYFVANTTPPVTPDKDAWTQTTGAVLRTLSTTKDATTETLGPLAIPATAGQSGLVAQFVSPPLDAQTLTGTVSIVFRAQEGNLQDNVNKRWRSVRVINSSGVTVATLDSLVATASTTELSATTLQGQQHANGSGFTTYNCAAGDRLLVAIGYGTSAGGTTPEVTCQWGGNGTDHANANSDTTGTVPWVEFSQNLVFQTTPSSVTLTPATATFTAPAVTAASGATSVTLTPVTLTSSAIALTVSVPPSTVTLTPITQTITAVPVTPAAGAVSVTLTPAAMTATAPAVTAAAGATSVTLTPAVMTTTARVIDPTLTNAPWVRDARESGTGAGTATTHSVAIPTCQVGDDLWASFTLNAGFVSVTAEPTGWTRVYPATITDGTTMTLLVYRKAATATEVAGGNVSVTVSTAVRGNAGAVSIANANTGALDASTSATGTGTATTGTSLTTTTANTLVLSIVAVDSGSEVATPPAGMIERWNPVRNGITGQVNAGATLLQPTAGAASWNWTWTTAGLDFKTWVGAIKSTAISTVTLTPAVTTITARPLTVSSAVILTPATATITAPALGPSAGAVNRTLTPAASTISAVAVSPTAGSTSVTLTPATLTSSAIAVSPTAGATSVTLTPKALTITAPAVVSTIVVQLSRPTATMTAVSVTATPQAVNVTLSPAAMSITAAALTVGSVGSATLSPAGLTVTAVPVAATSGAVTAALTPATFSITARPLSVTPIVPLTPATMSVTAVAMSTGVGATQVTLTPAAMSTTAVAPSVSLGAVQLTLTPAQINLNVPAVGATPGVVVRTLTPAVMTVIASPPDVDAGSLRVTLTPAVMTMSARSVTATPGAVEINLVPAAITISVVPGAISGILWTVNLVPAQITFTASPSGVYQSLPGVDLMTIAFATVTGVGEYIRGELESTEGGVPQRFALIVPGSIAWDNCDCGQFAQSITSVVSSRGFPTPATDVPVAPCGHPEAVVSVTVSLLRCVPNVDDRGNAPDVSKLLAAARVIEEDRQALRRALGVYLQDLRRAYKITNYTIGAAQSVGPEGMCGGIEVNYSFGIHNDAVTCSG